MTDSIFHEGGPYGCKRTEGNEYSFSISLPKDSEDRTARQCPSSSCSPAYFKIKNGTCISSDPVEAFCPYCRHIAGPSDFTTEEQIQYAEDLVMKEANKGVDRILRNSLGLGSSGTKKFGNSLLSVEMSYKSDTRLNVRYPFDEDLQRIVVCPHCSLDHAVFGLAAWCPGCGRDIFLTHVGAEYAVICTILSDIDRRRETLGKRVATRDIENCLEDIVSIYEAVLRALLVRSWKNKGKSDEEVVLLLKKDVGTRLQNPAFSSEIFRIQLDIDLFEGQTAETIEVFKRTLGKRHPITHNLGVVDRKYIATVLSAEREGRELRVTPDEINQAITISQSILSSLHGRLFLNSPAN
jgi:hypothetical protein